MIDVDTTLYIKTKTRRAVLLKRLRFSTLPRLGEHVKLRNADLGDYFAFQVDQITHREGDIPEMWLCTKQLKGGELVQYFWDEEEFEHDIGTYIQEGWVEMKKRRSNPNNASNATSEPAPGAASSAHEG